MVDMSGYPLFDHPIDVDEITTQQRFNRLFADAVYFGKIEKSLVDDDAGGDPQGVAIGIMFSRFIQNVRLEYLATNKIRIPFTVDRPQSIVVNGFPLQGTADIDLSAAVTGADATRYLFANRTADSTTFTITVSTSAVEGADQRLIGQFEFDGSDIEQDTITSYETDGFGIVATDLLAPKIVLTADLSGAIEKSKGVASLARGATGRFQVTFDEDFADTDYIVVCSVSDNANGVASHDESTVAVGACEINTVNAAGTDTNRGFSMVIFGDR